MPKKIITEKTLPVALHEIDQWSGKLTWELYAAKLASVLGEERISRYTLMSYPPLVEAFNHKKDSLRDVQDVSVGNQDFTLDFAKDQIATLESKLERLEAMNKLFTEQFVRWQLALYETPGFDLEKVNQTFSKIKLPEISRKR